MHCFFLPMFLAASMAIVPVQAPGDDVDEAAVDRVKAHLLEADRLAFDLERDPSRKPAALVAILGVKTDMTVLDLGAVAGYSNEILSVAVGQQGRVISHNTYLISRYLTGEAGQAKQQRMLNQRLPNVMEVNWLIDHIPLIGNIDLVYWGTNLHDYYNKYGGKKILLILEDFWYALKPGATLAIDDHVGKPENDNSRLHRVDPQVVEQLIRQAGFEILKTSDLYHNPNDNYEKSAWDMAVKGRTDRFIIVAGKPLTND